MKTFIVFFNIPEVEQNSVDIGADSVEEARWIAARALRSNGLQTKMVDLLRNIHVFERATGIDE